MNFIVVVDKNYGIGKDNNLLTYLPEDLKYYKRTTLNKVVVMGRKTLESLPGGKPFKERTNIIISRNKAYKCEGAIVVHCLDELFEELKKYPTNDIFIVGGAEIYNQLYSYCKYGYITKIKASFDANRHLDRIEDMPNWELIWQSEVQEYKGIEFVWTKYENTAI